MHSHPNYEIVREFKFIIIVLIVLYCTNPFRRTIFLLVVILWLVHLLS